MSIINISTIGSSSGVSVPSGAANVLGTLTILGGATSAQIDELFIQVRPLQTGRRWLLQLFSNDSGSDVELGDPLPIVGQNTGKISYLSMKVRIPAGTTIKAKCMDSAGTGQLIVAAQGLESATGVPRGAAPGVNAWKVLGPGADTSTNVYVAVDAGASANVFGANITIGTTAAAFNAIGVFFLSAVSGNVDMMMRVLDDGTEILQSIYHRGVSGDNLFNFTGVKRTGDIASGSVIQGQLSCSGSTVGSREMQMAVLLQNLPTAAGGGATRLVNGGLVR